MSRAALFPAALGLAWGASVAYSRPTLANTVPRSVPALVGNKPAAFGPFLLLQRLGTGGMAETYLAERQAATSGVSGRPSDFGRLVCVKVILPEKATDRDFIGWFFDEARIHARLHHDNIVQVYDFGEHEGRYYLTLEYVEGCELRKLMNLLASMRARLPQRLSAYIAHEIAQALSCAHSLEIDGVHQNLVHRDLSPHNVLVSNHGHAKLCDFGVVKARDRIMRTDTGTTKGKLPYMSPEQLNEPASIDGRTDLFALGVILFELLSGRHPFRRSSEEIEVQIATRILHGQRPKLRDVAPDINGGLCEVVEQLLETDRTQRIQSAAELVRLLEREPYAPTVSAARELAEYVQMLNTGGVPASALPLDTNPRRASLAPGRESKPDAPGAQDPTRSHVISSELALQAKHIRAQRKRLGWLAIALVMGAVALVLGIFTTRRSEQAAPRSEPLATAPVPKATAHTDPEPVNTEPVHVVSGDWEPPTTEPAKVALAPQPAVERAPQEEGAHSPAKSSSVSKTAKVLVSVDGRDAWEVWVDGVYMGQTPARVAVFPGAHTIAVGKDNPSRQQIVRVGAHQTKTIRFSP